MLPSLTGALLLQSSLRMVARMATRLHVLPSSLPTHIHTEVTCLICRDPKTACKKHDQLNQTGRKGHTYKDSLTYKNMLLSVYQGDLLLTQPWKGSLNTVLCCPAVGACFDWQLVMGGIFFSSKDPTLILAPAMILFLIFRQSKLDKTKLM